MGIDDIVVVAHDDVGVHGKPHDLPAQPCAAASLISSNVAVLSERPASRPKNAFSEPAGLAALKGGEGFSPSPLAGEGLNSRRTRRSAMQRPGRGRL